MNRDEYLLTCLAEECAEVAHRASKAMRFGIFEVQPGQTMTNEERLAEELGDLFAVVEILEGFGFKRTDTKVSRTAKKEKVFRFMEYSVKIGKLTL